MRKAALLAFGFMLASLVGIIQPAMSADALSGWKAGRIINDSVFTDYDSMSASQIQSFLNGKVSSCDTNGQQLSEYGGPDLNGDSKVQRWEWGKSKYNQTKFICIKDYTVDGKKASQIIYEKAQKYKISPRVLIVLLQKEQGLINDTWPLNIQYRSATGYGCPDTAPCDSQYYGLANQVDWAAKMFRAIMNDSPDWYTPYNVGTNYIQYNPQASCGGSNVYIENRSTQALYNYTPYQPNKGALDAGWGSATCGAYGNRNFYLYFSSWFGRPNGNPYESLDERRWLESSIEITKYDLVTGAPVDSPLPSGTDLFFNDKININGEVYLRTAYDSANNLQKGVKFSDLNEIPYVALASPRRLNVASTVYKVAPHSGVELKSQQVTEGSIPKFTSKTTVNGQVFYRTEYDTVRNIRRALPSAATSEVSYIDFKTPRYMQTSNDTNKVNPVLDTADTSMIAAGTQALYVKKINIDGEWYYQSSDDSDAGNHWSIPSSMIEEIKYESMPFSLMRLKSDQSKVNPATGLAESITLSAGTRLRFTDQVTVNGVTYYRSQYDGSRGLNKALDVLNLEAIPPVTYSSLPTTKLKLKESLRKQHTDLLNEVDSLLKSGSTLTFSSQTTIDGVIYYRTAYDTSRSLSKVIPVSKLTAP